MKAVEDVKHQLQRAGLRDVSICVDPQEFHNYQALLVYSYSSSSFKDGVLFGNTLARYIEDGGGVVVCVFAGCSNLTTGFLQGQFDKYHPFVPGTQEEKRNANMGEVVEPDHPIMRGVSSFSGGSSSFWNPGKLKSNAKLIASWDSKLKCGPLIAELKTKAPSGKVIGLNFFPPSSDCETRFWDSSTDGHKIMANALQYANRYSSRYDYKHHRSH